MKKIITAVFFSFLTIFFLHSIAAASSGSFKAEGKRGWVKFFAQKGYVEVEGRGKLWVRTGRDARAEMDGTFETHEMEDQLDLYKGFNGKVKVSGMNFRVEFRGEAIKFRAVGEGKAALRGEGTFSVNGGDAEEWGKDYKWAHCRY